MEFRTSFEHHAQQSKITRLLKMNDSFTIVVHYLAAKQILGSV